MPTRPLKIGTVLDAGRFTIGRVLGDGSFAIVYLARDADGTLVAIKEYLPRDLAGRAGNGLGVVPRRARTGSPGFAEGLKAFGEEGTLLSRIHHPNVVVVRHRFAENDTAYIVMAYRLGQTLAERIAGTGPLHSTEAALVGLQVLAALRNLHEGPQSCVHRDVKPDNIYLCEDGTVLLLDFGAATRTGQSHAEPGFDHATPGYAPPEQWNAGKPESSAPAVDIYAWAAVVHTALTSVKPTAATDHESAWKKGGISPLALSPPNDALTRLLWKCVWRGLSLTPGNRPTAAALHWRLRGLLERPSHSQFVGAVALMSVFIALLGVLHLARQAEQILTPLGNMPAGRTYPVAQSPLPSQPLSFSPAPSFPQAPPFTPVPPPQPARPTTVTKIATVCGDSRLQYEVYTRKLQPYERLVGVWQGRWVQTTGKKTATGKDHGCGVVVIQPDLYGYSKELYLYVPSRPTPKIPIKAGQEFDVRSTFSCTDDGGTNWLFDYQNDGSLRAKFENSGIEMEATFELVPGSR